MTWNGNLEYLMQESLQMAKPGPAREPTGRLQHSIRLHSCWEGSLSHSHRFHAGSGVERIDPPCFLAGCHKRFCLYSLLAWSFFWVCFLLLIRARFCVVLVCVCVCSVSWLFWLSCQYLTSDWLERLLRGRLFMEGDYLHKAQAEEHLWLFRFSVLFCSVFVLSSSPTQYKYSYSTI